MIQHQADCYTVKINELRGTVESLQIYGKEYVGKQPVPIFQLQLRDEDCMESVAINTFDGHLSGNEKNGNSYRLTYDHFPIKGLRLHVLVTLDTVITWDLEIENNDWYYVEWVDFPQIAVPNDVKRGNGYSKMVWDFQCQHTQRQWCQNRRQINGQETNFDYASIPSLYQTYKAYFHMAVAVEPRDLIQYRDLIVSQFNELTTENRMKPTNIHPKEHVYAWTGTDQIVAFARQHGMRVRGHGLVYEKVMPQWFFRDEKGNRASKELVMERLEQHVKTIVSRYKGQIYCYDVVNEVFGHEDWDTRDLTAICGIGFVPLVYQWAHEADPDAILILNDNYHDIPKKRMNIYRYVKRWKEDGAPIHGIGFQDHLFLDTSLEAVEETLALFSTIPDFKIYVTELDLNAYPFEDFTSCYPDYMVDEILELCAKKYAALFDIYRKYAAHIETIGFWNVCDKRSWLDEYYVCGRKHFALPFDENGEPKASFWRIVDLVQKLPRWTKGTQIPPIRNNHYTIDPDTNILTVKGTNQGEYYGSVKAELYSDFGRQELLYSAVQEAAGGYAFSIPIDTEEQYDGRTSPDYILSVTEQNGEVKTDRFTYYSKKQQEQYYTITDQLTDFTKTYSVRNCVLESHPEKYDGNAGGVKPQWFWGNGTFGPGQLLYRIPDGFLMERFEMDMYTENSRFYCVSVSSDGKTYYEATVKWAPVPTASGKQRFCGTVTAFPSDTKYIEIDLSAGFSDYWRAYEGYLAAVRLYTKRGSVK